MKKLLIVITVLAITGIIGAPKAEAQLGYQGRCQTICQTYNGTQICNTYCG